jgi:hypothetical protein
MLRIWEKTHITTKAKRASIEKQGVFEVKWLDSLSKCTPYLTWKTGPVLTVRG